MTDNVFYQILRNIVNNNKFNLITSLPPDSGKICYKIKFIIIHKIPHNIFVQIRF